ncbi:11206_t:CDS:1 [Dentiscutata erythropus]|uniref:11206_t:CDS:1 n=1 Tax=Dentiscutata erythropus TaxID=1348616 RepID=A0A9N9EE97_9GLOM|nr:11206_t:CDS:1 [Dentiscutata erythropus]
MPRVKKDSIDPSSLKRRKHDPCLDRIPDLKTKLKESIKKHLESMSQQGVVFPTNLPLEILLAPSKRTMKNLKGKTGEKKRAQNGFILYRKDNHFIIQKDYPLASQPEISKIVKKRWETESAEKKNYYTILSSVDFLVHNELFGAGSSDYNIENADHGSSSDKEFVDDQDDEPWKRAVTMPQMVLLPIAESQECFESTENSQRISSSLQPAFYLQNIVTAKSSRAERHSSPSPVSKDSDHMTDFYRCGPWNVALDNAVTPVNPSHTSSDSLSQSNNHPVNASELYAQTIGASFNQRTEYNFDLVNYAARMTNDFCYAYNNTSTNIYYPHLLSQTPVVLSNDSSVMVISPLPYDNCNIITPY